MSFRTCRDSDQFECIFAQVAPISSWESEPRGRLPFATPLLLSQSYQIGSVLLEGAICKSTSYIPFRQEMTSEFFDRRTCSIDPESQMPCLALSFLMDSYTLGCPMLFAIDFTGDSCRQPFSGRTTVPSRRTRYALLLLLMVKAKYSRLWVCACPPTGSTSCPTFFTGSEIISRLFRFSEHKLAIYSFSNW